ncbi:MAG: hypothetical protein HC904_10065 [Blastochloris sp.]|nr:hypothetical protein [Blastochloris sp.]
MNGCLMGPSGVFPGWDQHGFQRETAGATSAYLAWRTGSEIPAQPILFGDLWERSGSFAWVRDDHVWQWIWLPDPGQAQPPQSGVACHPESWVEKHVAGALLDADCQLRLFQMWDISGPRPVRGHMNPNSLLLEACGSLLTVDGNGLDDFPLNDNPAMSYTHYYSKKLRNSVGRQVLSGRTV